MIQADITQTFKTLNLVGSEDFRAVVMNAPWNITRDCFDIAQHYQPPIIIAVLPLDVMQETDPQLSYRYQSERATVEENRKFMSVFRDKSAWELVAEVRYAYIDRHNNQRDDYFLLDFVEFSQLEKFAEAIGKDAEVAAMFASPS